MNKSKILKDVYVKAPRTYAQFLFIIWFFVPEDFSLIMDS